MNNKSFFLALASCGLITLRLTEKYLNIKEAELEQFVVSGHLDKELVKEKFALVTYYYLTEKGEKYIKETYFEINNIYRGFIKAHDLRLCEFYLERTQQEQNTWITRDDITIKYNPLGELKGSLDGGYFKNNEYCFVKVLEKNSSITEIERIEEFIKKANIKNITYIFY